MSSVGIIANPAAGKDIRRIVAQGRFVPNHEKVNILKRTLAGLDAAGVEGVLFMPDSGAMGRSALDGADLRLSADFVEMPVFNAELDSSRAAKEMLAADVSCIITLGGDGTNRAVAKECGDIPLVPISTGTNNVFPSMIEGTVAGLAAGAIATGRASVEEATTRHCRLEVLVDGVLADLALVDLAVTTERFVGARAVWDIGTIHELFLTRAAATNIGLSSIGGQLRPTSPEEPVGIRVKPGAGTTKVLAAVAPGVVRRVEIADWEVIDVHSPPSRVDLRPGTIALDGERALRIPDDKTVEVRLSADGPTVVDLGRALSIAASSGSRGGPTPADTTFVRRTGSSQRLSRSPRPPDGG